MRSARPASARPYITLGVRNRVDLPAARQIVQELAPKAGPVVQDFVSVAAFARTGILYFAPTVTRQRLDVHEGFQQRVAPASRRMWRAWYET